MSKPKKDKSEKAPKPTLAERADKYVCYQKSVQEPEHEVTFFDQAYKDAFGRKKPLHLREDFCGTFAVCCEWVKSSPKRTALGVDLDPEPLSWGKANNLSQLTETQKKRVRLVEQDVRKRNRPQADILAAQNFSFWLFKTRDAVVEYFKVARSNLAAQGLMVMDMMGGGECLEEGHKDVRTIEKGKRGFKYIWTQETHNPINADAKFTISFKFKDGSKLAPAFTYEWRFWTIPEVMEMLKEAGFSESHVYWEVLDEAGEETGEWERTLEAPSDPSWVCYIVAVK
ncbi:MAG: class I SAM-dependent methyltransferase [Planctomycetota bacterium]